MATSEHDLCTLDPGSLKPTLGVCFVTGKGTGFLGFGVWDVLQRNKDMFFGRERESQHPSYDMIQHATESTRKRVNIIELKHNSIVVVLQRTNLCGHPVVTGYQDSAVAGSSGCSGGLGLLSGWGVAPGRC